MVNSAATFDIWSRFSGRRTLALLFRDARVTETRQSAVKLRSQDSIREEWTDGVLKLTFGLSPPEASLSFSGCELSLRSCSSAEPTTRAPIR